MKWSWLTKDNVKIKSIVFFLYHHGNLHVILLHVIHLHVIHHHVIHLYVILHHVIHRHDHDYR